MSARKQPSFAELPSHKLWRDIHNSADGLFVGECWTNCNSYCCKTNRAEQDFSLMKCGSAGMVFPMGEYKFLKDNNLLQEGFEDTAKEHEYIFDQERGLSLKFVTAHCDLGGICSDALWRPLICKFYPLYPVIDPKSGKVSSYTYGSIIDQYWEALKIEHPCWLLRTHEAALKTTIEEKSVSLMQHPYVVFYFSAANIFVNHVAKRSTDSYETKPISDPRQFFREWELSYLTGQLVDSDSLKKELIDLYDSIAEHCGDFHL